MSRNMMKAGYLKSASILAALAIVAPSTAFAQVGADSSQVEDGERDEVVVTAQKREQRLQDAALSVTALNEEALERRGIQELIDAVAAIPGLAVTNEGPGTTSVSIRGLSSSGANLREGASIGYYLDEVPVTLPNNAFNAQVDPDFFDLSRIEVLRGPQGTLYGSGSIGGTIRYLYNEPVLDDYQARGRVTFMSTRKGAGDASLNAMVNMPLIEGKAGVRATGYFKNTPGYIDFTDQNGETTEDINDVETLGGRLSALIKLGDNIDLLPTVYYHSAKFGSNFDYDAALPGIQVSRFFPSNGEDEYKLYSLTARMDFGWADLTSVTAYFDRDYQRQSDYSQVVSSILAPFFGGTYEPGISTFDITAEQFTQEARLASSGEGPLAWIFGLYYSNTKSTQFQRIIAPGAGDFFGGSLLGFDVSDDVLFDGLTVVRDQQAAAFGEVSYEVLPGLSATVGIRGFNASQRNGRDLDRILAGGPVDFELNTSENGVIPKYLLSYQPGRNHLLYASATKGFRVGGTNSPVPDACAPDLVALGLTEPPTRFTSDSVWSYEVGSKNAWFENRLSANVSAYQVEWDDLQQSAALPTCGFSFTGNSGKARSRGLELETAARPIDGFDVTAAYGFIDSQLRRDAPALGAESGDELLGVPKHTFSASAQYAFRLAQGLGAYVRGDYRYYGRVRQTYSPTAANIFRPSFDQINMRLGLQGRRWDAAFFVQNVLDERGIVGLALNPNAIPINGVAPIDQVITRPRTIGISITGSL